MSEPKIIFWDLETLPDPNMVLKNLQSIGNWPGRTMKAEMNSIISFGYKFLGADEAEVVNAWDFPNWDEDVNDDSALVGFIYEMLKQADGICTHNGKSFDVKVLNTRLAKHGYPPLHKIPHADTKIVAKRGLSLYSNSLNNVAKFFGCENKLKHDGWDMWMAMYKRDRRSMDLMSRYCAQDVEVLEQVFLKLRPYMKNSELPNYNIFTTHGVPVCPNCGSDKVHRNGTRMLKGGPEQRYLCTQCGTGHYIKVGKKTKTVKHSEV